MHNAMAHKFVIIVVLAARCPLILAEREGSKTNSLTVDNHAATHRRAAHETRHDSERRAFFDSLPTSLVNLKERLDRRVGNEADVEKKNRTATKEVRLAKDTPQVERKARAAAREEKDANHTAHRGQQHEVSPQSLAEEKVESKVKAAGDVPADGAQGSFTAIDVDGSGEIDEKEFAAALVDPDAKAAKDKFDQVDKKKEGNVNKGEWETAYKGDILKANMFKDPAELKKEGGSPPAAGSEGPKSGATTAGSRILLVVFIVLVATASNLQV
mmetsp:Transcript_45171/g.79525  ORF Transcript_45171/g.79525 Transcript_45171/m.79525 type:complete len:271 (+) Transcript_45171:66-878(+)